MWSEFKNKSNKVITKVDDIECAVYENLLFTAQAKLFADINAHFIWIECDCSNFITQKRTDELEEKSKLLDGIKANHIGYVIVAKKPLFSGAGVILTKVNLLIDGFEYYETEQLTENKLVNAEELYFISRVINSIELDWD